MIRYALVSNGIHNPFLRTVLPEHMLYPIAQNFNGQKDLDYTSLLLGDGYIIDCDMFDAVLESKTNYLRPMKHSFEVLQREGLLETVRCADIFEQYKQRIITMTEEYLKDINTWMGLAQAQWKSLKPELVVFQNNYGSNQMLQINTGNMGIENWLSESDQKDNEILRTNLYDLFEGRTRIEAVGEDNARGALRFIVSQIVMSDLFSYATKTPVLDWDDSAEMYKQIYKLRWHNYADELELRTRNAEAFKVMEYIVPNLIPCRIEDVVHFIRYDNAVSSLREALLDAIQNGVDIDNTWMARYLGIVLEKEFAHKKWKNRFGIAGLVSSFIPMAAPITAIVGATTYIANEVVDTSNPEYNWIMALQSKKRKSTKLDN